MILECAYRLKGKDKLVYEKHSHEHCYELIQTFSNGGNFLIKDTLYQIKTGSIFLINAIDIHCAVPANPDEYIRSKVIVDSEKLDDVAKSAGFEHIIASLFKDNNCALITLPSVCLEEADRIFEDIYRLYRKNDKNDGLKIILLILRFLQICFENQDEKLTQRTGSVENVIKYINENITDDLTLEKISEALFISKYHLCRNFKKTTGMTVLEYIKERRISMAKKKLQFSDMTIAEIARNCGFSNFSHFSKLFKEFECVTPTQYRTKHKI